MSARPSSVRDARGGPAREPHLRVVRRGSRRLIKRRQARRAAPVAIVATMAIVALVFGVLLEQVVLAQSAFKLTRIRTKLVAAEARHEELLLEAAKLESPGRVERYAREVLGMVDPADVEYVVADVVAPRDAVARVPRPGGPVLPPGDASAAATWAEPEGP